MWPLPHDPDDVIRDCASATVNRNVIRAGTASLHVGASLARVGRYTEAISVLGEAITYLHGRDAVLVGRAYFVRGQALASNHALTQAIADLQASVDSLPPGEVPDAELSLADAYWERRDGSDADTAASLFAGVIARLSFESALYRRERLRAYLGLADIAETSGDLGLAADYYRRAVNEDPDHFEAQMGLGKAALGLRESTTARAAFEKAFDLARTNPVEAGGASEAATGVAEALRQLGQHDEERIRFLRHAAEEAPLDDATYLVAYADELAWGTHQDLAESERWYRDANARASEQDEAIWLKLARVQFRRGAHDASTASVQRARLLAPDAPDVVLFDGQLSYALGRWQEAIDAFWRAKNLQQPLVKAEARFYLSKLFTETQVDAATLEKVGIDQRTFPARSLAVGFADEAVKQFPDDLRYRAQACLARIRYVPEVRVEDAVAVCDQVGTGAEGQLLRGVARIRAAPYGAGARIRTLDAAYGAFEVGLRAEDAATYERRLRYGMGLALRCGGFDGAARVHLAGLPSEWEWFQSYGATCNQKKPEDGGEQNG